MKKSESEVKKTKVENKKHNKDNVEKTLITKEKEKKNKRKVNIFKAISKYFRGVGTETKRIKWTTTKELIKYSIASIVFVVFFGLYFYTIDWIALLVRSLAN